MEDLWEEDVILIHKTDAAIRVNYNGIVEWLPASCINDDSEICLDSEIEETGTLIIPQWLAEEKGLA